jgi:hypothetical protein
MTTTSDESEDSRALAGLTDLYLDKVEPATETEIHRGLDAFVTRVHASRRAKRGLVRWSLVGATAALCVFAVLHATSSIRTRWSTPEVPALAYQVDGGSVLEGGYLRELGHAGMKVVFNEGSRFDLAPGTRGRIRAVDREGAHMAIEHGTASIRVTQGGGRRWLVDVGPFLVTVKGTAFTVSWDPLGEQFDLRLRHGQVVVNGPLSSGEIALRAGQRLVVSLARAETVISEETPEQAGEPTEVAASQTVTPPDLQPSGGDKPITGAGPTTASVSSTAARSGAERRWTDALARGHWDRILDDVRRVGVQTALSRASSEDLFALADAARYRRRPDLARAALLAQRRRFPDSPRSLDALFLLGRTEESTERGIARAVAWYDEYLARAPTGPFVGEALGRKMTLTEQLEGPRGARRLAEEYLRRFPKGSYAGSARELIRAP